MLDRIWRGRLGGLRLVMILAVMSLVLVGLAAIHATDLTKTPPTRFAQKQLQWVAISLVAFLAANLISYRNLGRFSYLLFFLTLMLLVFVLVGKYLNWTSIVPEMQQRGGATLDKPHSQPADNPPAASEIAKLTYILALAWYLRHRHNYRSFKGLIIPFLLTLVPMALILLEPDLGTILLFLPVLFAVLFVAGRAKHLLTIIILALMLSPVFYFLMEPYQRQRIQILIRQNSEDPFWRLGPGYQLYRSKLYIGTGQLTGQGFEINPAVRNISLPDRHNDFIFAVIAHQWGFIGAVGLLVLFTLVILGGIEIASQQVEPFGRLLAVGVSALMAAQMFINIAMTMGLMPITGLTLPFVSYGGSSLLCNFFAFGLLINVARHRPMQLARKPFEFDRD